MKGLRIIFALWTCLSAGVVFADTAIPTARDTGLVAPALPLNSCYCTDKTGSRVELGQVICLQVDGRMFTARCEMSLNNPMWREQTDGCMSSGLFQSLNPALDARTIYTDIAAAKS